MTETDDWLMYLAKMLEGDELTDWEIDFSESVVRQAEEAHGKGFGFDLTEKQMYVVKNIHRRCGD